MVKPFDELFKLNAGGELRLLKGQLALRCGYSTSNDLDDGFTAGIGIAQRSFQLNYAFVPYGELGNTHRVSLMMWFDRE